MSAYSRFAAKTLMKVSKHFLLLGWLTEVRRHMCGHLLQLTWISIWFLFDFYLILSPTPNNNSSIMKVICLELAITHLPKFDHAESPSGGFYSFLQLLSFHFCTLSLLLDGWWACCACMKTHLNTFIQCFLESLSQGAYHHIQKMKMQKIMLWKLQISLTHSLH